MEKTELAAKTLFENVAPERKDDMIELWEKYSPKYSIQPEDGDEGKFVMQAGMYRDIWFNHRAMRAFWFGAFIAWEGYKNIVNGLNLKDSSLTDFSSMVDQFQKIMKLDESDSVELPFGIPEPGVYTKESEARAAGEIATIATGWAFLHEMKHIQHQQEGTSAPSDSTPKEKRDEEYSCDEYATKFLLDKIIINDEYESTILKRQLAIYFALFTMTLINHDNWDESDTHPSLQARIDKVVQILKKDNLDRSTVIGICSFSALLSKWENAPAPFKLS